MAAAYAGIEEYQSRLANDPTYLSTAIRASPFSNGTGERIGRGQRRRSADRHEENEAFGVGAAGTWADVAGSGGEASYRYEVDNSQYYETGTLYLRSTGRVGDETRTIVADLRQQGFIDFLYFTDYEIQDPVMSGANAASCVRYAYAGGHRPDAARSPSARTMSSTAPRTPTIASASATPGSRAR